MNADINWRDYFSFIDYEYFLDIQKQGELIEDTINIRDGLREAYEWYVSNQDKVNKKPYFEFIDEHFN